MFIPLRTEIETRRPPLVTPLLVLLNGLALLVILGGERLGRLDPGPILESLALHRSGFRWWQPITYQFLHDLRSIWHLLFNMLFLWVFGCAVEERLGRIGFLAFYLAGGAISGMAHIAISPNPVIGASGAVAACSGAFLALFPRAQIKVLFIFLLIGIVHVPAALFIGLYIVFNLVMQFSSLLGAAEERVAYMAHLAGYAYGFVLCLGLLAAGLLPRRDVDVWYLITQAQRRRAMRQAMTEAQRGVERLRRRSSPGAQRPRLGPSGASGAPGRPTTAVAPPPPPSPAPLALEHEAPAAKAARREIEACFARLDVAGAADAYARLLSLNPAALLPEPRLLDVANQFLADGRNDLAASCYERLLGSFPRSDRADEVRLLLATIWTRRIPQPSKARPLLEALRPRLRDAAHLALADQLLRELPA